jgi:HEAT repeats
VAGANENGAGVAAARIPEISALIAALDAPDADERRLACRSLANLGDPAAVEALIAAASERGPEVEQMALEALRESLPDGEPLVKPADAGSLAAIQRTLGASIPPGWSWRDSTTVYRDDGELNVICSDEPVGPGVDTDAYANEYAEMISEQCPGYSRLSFGRAEVFGGRPGYLHWFRQQNPGEVAVVQGQAYFTANGRGYVATATCSADSFGIHRGELLSVLNSLRVDLGRGRDLALPILVVVIVVLVGILLSGLLDGVGQRDDPAPDVITVPVPVSEPPPPPITPDPNPNGGR